jgi:NadR type nicotinamide-nucleotide adenylyltransferase
MTNLKAEQPEKDFITGLIVGKFAPPHLGHVFLAQFARGFCDRLVILVEEDASDLLADDVPTLAMAKRLEMLAETLPGCEIYPVLSRKCAGDRARWVENAQALVGKVDFFFSGDREDYRLSQAFAATFIPLDPDRQLTPVSSSLISLDPFSQWQFLPPAVRSYYSKKVCVFGAESTGKSTLTANLGRHFETSYVPEYARTLLEFKNNELDESDLWHFAVGMVSSFEAMSRRANRVIFADTDALTTKIWSEWIYKRYDRRLDDLITAQSFDLYLVPDVDVPWVEDPQRYLPNERESFRDYCIARLDELKRPYRLIKGSFAERHEQAVAAVEALFAPEKSVQAVSCTVAQVVPQVISQPLPYGLPANIVLPSSLQIRI